MFQNEERMKVADAMTTKSYKDGDIILNQGDPADFFYIVIDGHVVIRRRGDNQVSWQYVVSINIEKNTTSQCNI